MNRKILTLASVMFASLSIWAHPAYACIHPGRDVAGEGEELHIDVREQQAVLMRLGDERQRLVLGAAFQSDRPLPTAAWLIPVPSPPERYATASPETFPALARFVPLQRLEELRPRARSKSRGAATLRERSVALRKLPAASVGPYDVQPLQVGGPRGLAALEAWLDEHEFVSPPREALLYYAERRWTFLAIKVSPRKGEEALTGGELAPLMMDFAYDRQVFPLKILQGHGTFPARLYVIADDPLRRDVFESPRRHGFEVARGFGVPYLAPLAGQKPRGELKQGLSVFTIDQVPSALRTIFEDSGFDKERKLTMRVLFQERLDTSNEALGRQPEDLCIPPLAEGERLMGRPGKMPPATSGEDTAQQDMAPEVDAGEGAPASAGSDGDTDPKSAPDEDGERRMGKGAQCQTAPARAPSGAPGSSLLLLALAGLGLVRRRRE